MHRCDRVERIFDYYLHFIATPHAYDWPKNRRRIAKSLSWLAVNESVPTGHGFHAYGVSLLCRIDQRWNWQFRAAG